MIRSILRLAVILVIGVLIYNYFLGDPGEKETAKKIFGEIKEVGVAVKDLLQSEKEKFDSGKYDQALDKIGGLFNNLKENAETVSSFSKEIDALEARRKELSDQLHDHEPATEEEQNNFKKEMQNLIEQAEKMVEKME